MNLAMGKGYVIRNVLMTTHKPTTDLGIRGLLEWIA